MMKRVQLLLQEARNAYLVGIQKKPSGVSDDIFQSVLAAVLDRRLPPGERELIRRSQVFCQQGLASARDGDLVAAEQFFQKADAFLHSDRLSVEGTLLCRSFYEAAAAYFDYRRHDFDQAIARIYQALSIDISLEEIPDYALLQSHRLKLLLNLLRIQARRSAFQEAITIGSQVLDYLEQKSGVPSIATSWDSSRLVSLPRRLREIQFSEAAGELALLLAGVEVLETGSERLSVCQLFAGLGAHTQEESVHSCYLSKQAHMWLKSKQALIDGRIENFLQETILLLSNGTDEMPLLWHASIVDLIFLCSKLDFPEANLIRKEVAADALSWVWERLPQAWKTILGLPPAEERNIPLQGRSEQFQHHHSSK